MRNEKEEDKKGKKKERKGKEKNGWRVRARPCRDGEANGSTIPTPRGQRPLWPLGHGTGATLSTHLVQMLERAPLLHHGPALEHVPVLEHVPGLERVEHVPVLENVPFGASQKEL